MNKIAIPVGNVSLPAGLNDSPVNSLRRVIGDATRLCAVKDGTQVRLTREDQP
jgi:hypothetical protein